jgi:virginiamycin B lyase
MGIAAPGAKVAPFERGPQCAGSGCCWPLSACRLCGRWAWRALPGRWVRRSVEQGLAGVSGPLGVVVSSDGALWFTNAGNGTIGRLDSEGMLDRFTTSAMKRPWAITVGPDGALWFTDRGSDAIGRITTSDTIRLYRDKQISDPVATTAGPDGALWFTNEGNDSIGRISTSGRIRTFRDSSISAPQGITAGPDGALWSITLVEAPPPEGVASAIGRITTRAHRLRDRKAEPPELRRGSGGRLGVTRSPCSVSGRTTGGRTS